jgi:hypothetical protein
VNFFAAAANVSGRRRGGWPVDPLRQLLGWRPEFGIIALVVFLLGVSFPMHNFWAEPGTA